MIGRKLNMLEDHVNLCLEAHPLQTKQCMRKRKSKPWANLIIRRYKQLKSMLNGILKDFCSQLTAIKQQDDVTIS